MPRGSHPVALYRLRADVIQEEERVLNANVGRGPLIAGISAVLLLIFMFFSWYGLDSVSSSGFGFEQEITGDQLDQFAGLGGESLDTSANAWQAFSLIDLILFVCIVGIIAMVIAGLAGAAVNMPVSPGTIIAGLGGIAFLLILFRLIFTPDGGGDVSDFAPAGVEVDVDVSRKIGLFLGFLASIGMAIGGWLTHAGGGRLDSATSAAPPPPPPPAPPAGQAPPAQQRRLRLRRPPPGRRHLHHLRLRAAASSARPEG